LRDTPEREVGGRQIRIQPVSDRGFASTDEFGDRPPSLNLRHYEFGMSPCKTSTWLNPWC
jgi:hypothetical protein